MAPSLNLRRAVAAVIAVMGAAVVVLAFLGAFDTASGSAHRFRQIVGTRIAARGADTVSNQNADSTSVAALRRASTPSDERWATAVAPNISQPIAENELNIHEARLAIATPEGAAGLIPGKGSICFVSDTGLLGTVTSCTPDGWAAAHGGWGIVGTIKGRTIVQGVVPDHVTRVVFDFRSGASAAVTLNAEHAYSETFTSEPVKMSSYAGELTVAQTAFGTATPRAYFN
jgi:hypothetical protein